MICVSRRDEEEGRIVFVLARVESFAPRHTVRHNGVFEQSKRARKWSESRALAAIARARVPSGRPTSHLGDRHLVPHITLVRVASTSDGYRRLENARVERNKFVTRGAAAHVALVDCFR